MLLILTEIVHYTRSTFRFFFGGGGGGRSWAKKFGQKSIKSIKYENQERGKEKASLAEGSFKSFYFL